MALIPPITEQKQIIEAKLSQKLSDECIMISRQWWDRWRSFVNCTTDAHPGPVSNSDLVILSPGVPIYEAPFDWTYATLKENLAEYTDYVLVSHAAWLQLRAWYQGGPAIHIFIVGKTAVDPRCKIGQPDTKPVKLMLVVQEAIKKDKLTGILVSLEMTGKQLYRFLYGQFPLSAHSMCVEWRKPGNGELVEIKNDSNTLKDYGITGESTIYLRENPIPSKAFERAIAKVQLTKDAGCGGSYHDDDDLTRAIQASLEDQGGREKFHAFASEKYKGLVEFIKVRETLPEKLREEFEERLKAASKIVEGEKISIAKKAFPQILQELDRIEQYAASLVKTKENCGN